MPGCGRGPAPPVMLRSRSFRAMRSMQGQGAAGRAGGAAVDGRRRRRAPPLAGRGRRRGAIRWPPLRLAPSSLW